MSLIFKFEPYLKPVIWGGEKIAALKGIKCQDNNIGESWEISGVPGHESVVSSGEDKGLTLPKIIAKYGDKLIGKSYDPANPSFPLLIKIIDAKRDLSVQVHPDDTLAAKRHNCKGKTEMWYIVGSEPGAKIYAGLSKQLSPELYEKAIAEDTIMDALAAHESHPGDVFFLPAGRVHAIGAGNILVEVQQTSDITYRIYDYNRVDADGKPRQLHTEQAKDAIDYTIYPDYVTDYDKTAKGAVRIVGCKYFQVDKLTVDGQLQINDRTSFVTLTCVEGKCEVRADGETASLAPGETCLVAASAANLTIEGHATLISSML